MAGHAPREPFSHDFRTFSHDFRTFSHEFRNFSHVYCRLKLLKSITDQIYDFPVSKDWKLNGRPCSPRVLFIFESCSIETFTDEQETTPGGFRNSRPQVRLFGPFREILVLVPFYTYGFFLLV